MKNYRLINNVAGWVVFAVASIVYLMTVERTASYWDCGEFIAAAYKLEVPHPPGAPMFLLIGRMFTLFANGSIAEGSTNAAYLVNLVSVFSSSFTILFLFWSITMLGKKLILKAGEIADMPQTIAIIGAGVVGSLAYTFSDTFWFSAVEAEVYAMSSFFTAIVFWAILKWEIIKDDVLANRWLILLAFLMGLSIGVHLLNLVAIPALAMAYYFKNYQEANWKGGLIAFIVGVAIVGVINALIIPGIPSLAGSFEIFFINSIGMPYGSGIIIFTLLFVGALVYGIYYSIQKQKVNLNTALLAFAFILIGYSSYMIIPIRSAYNPPIDENNPEDVLSFVSYLKREQYGERPLLYGPTIRAEVIEQEDGDPKYKKEDGKYVIYDYKVKNIHDPKHMTLFPRIYSQQSHHKKLYKNWVNLPKSKKAKITLGHNLSYFWTYQIKHMYWRYFMWNFAGREHDIQDADWMSPANSESEEDLPHIIASSKARNQYYMLPFVLGVLGLVFHYMKNNKDTLTVFLLFFFTGIGVIIFLNQPPVEPRERDYTYVGSFYAFAIWIGLGVLALYDWLSSVLKNNVMRAGVCVIMAMVVPFVMVAEGWDDHDRSGRWNSVDSAKALLDSCEKNAILFCGGDNDTFPVWYVQEVEQYRTDVRVCNLSLLNTDWYIDLMRQRAYLSEGLPITFTHDQYVQGTNDYLPFVENPKVKGGMDLPQFIKLVREEHPAIQVPLQKGGSISTFPTKVFTMDVDKNDVLKKGIIPKGFENKVVNQMKWKFKKRNMEKKHLIMFDMLANNNWERPFYFSTTVSSSDYLGLSEYFQLEGLAYKVLPIRNKGNQFGRVQTDIMYDNMVNKLSFKGLNDETRFFNENYRRLPSNARDKFHRLAEALYNEGDKDKAKEVLDYSLEVMPDKALPYDYNVAKYIDLYLKLGEKDKAFEMINLMLDRCPRTLEYYEKQDIKEEAQIQFAMYTLNQMMVSLNQAKEKEKAAEVQQVFQKYYKDPSQQQFQ